MRVLAVLTACAALGIAQSARAAGPPELQKAAPSHEFTTEALVARGLAPGKSGSKVSHEFQVDALVARGLAETGKSKPFELTTDPLVAKGLH
jgi:hypothetical protein